jgi:hypothetical protein
VSKLIDLATELETPFPALREIEKLARRRDTLAAEISWLEQEYVSASTRSHITESRVARILGSIAVDIDGINQHISRGLERSSRDDRRKDVLDPNSHAYQINYESALICGIVASPRGFEPLLPP